MLKHILTILGALVFGALAPAAAQQKYTNPCCTIKQVIQKDTNLVYGRVRIDSLKIPKNGNAPRAWSQFTVDSVRGPVLYRWHDTTVYTYKDSVVVRDSVVPVFDTAHVEVFDTIPVFDTVRVEIFDTTKVTVYDTVPGGFLSGVDTTKFRDSLVIQWWSMRRMTDSTKTVRISGSPTLGTLPFGMMAQPVADLGGNYTYSLLAEWANVIEALPTIHAKGATVMINPTGSGSCAKNAAGLFQLDLWKACYKAKVYDDVNRRTLLTAYADSGTVLAMYILDEPNHKTRWGPDGTITQAMIEEMAAYSKSLFPNLKTVVRAAPDWLDDWNGEYVALDGTWAQYRRSRGPIQAYVDNNMAGARRLGLCLVFSLNIRDGGDGSSGWDSGNGLWYMSPSEILEYGRPMLEAQPWAVSAWDWYPSYLSRPGVMEALDQLGAVAKTKTRSC